jgi:hypothetical protein
MVQKNENQKEYIYRVKELCNYVKWFVVKSVKKLSKFEIGARNK